MKYTGFKCGREPLYVGDIVSYQQGYYGYFEVIEKPSGFWLTDCSEKVLQDTLPPEEINEDQKLDRNLGVQYTKVDKNNPTKEPPVKIYCDQCDETAVGEVNDITGEITWYKSCGRHNVSYTKDGNIENITAICNLCITDPTRKPPKDEVMEYFKKRYEECEVTVVPGHWPQFKTKVEVDKWINSMKMMPNYFDYVFSKKFKDTDTKE